MVLKKSWDLFLKGEDMSRLRLLTLFLPLIPFLVVAKTPRMVIVTASYNNVEWLPNYFNSLISQTYRDWIVIYIDDNSTDNTIPMLEALIQNNKLTSQFVVIKNKKRMGHLLNQYSAIYACDPETIIVILDGDDWLATEYALETIYNTYQDDNTWLTYGQFWYLAKNKKGFCKPIPQEVIKANGIRDISWRTSHPRTFYAGLFHRIQFTDLLYEGHFFPKCADVATMFPMIEMAGTHVTFIPDVLYMYNDANPISYHHDPTEQRKIEDFLRKKARYQPLKEQPWLKN